MSPSVTFALFFVLVEGDDLDAGMTVDAKQRVDLPLLSHLGERANDVGEDVQRTCEPISPSAVAPRAPPLVLSPSRPSRACFACSHLVYFTKRGHI